VKQAWEFFYVTGIIKSTMLSSRNRFHGHGSLRFVYSRGQVVRSKSFILKYSENKRRTQPRIAVVVSKKVIKSAVKRNRIRRRLYEAIRLELPRLSPQSDIVLIVTSVEVLVSPSNHITDSVGGVLERASLYKEE
jgi:ribonuclease P protein component